ncbi:MAG TPA: hypothetical protein VIX82_03300, partial [Solirubrobacteraceae bacterium]
MGTPEGRVRETVLCWVERDAHLGRVSIRHVLTGQLKRRGGHIGYDVRPSARRRARLRASILGTEFPVDESLAIVLRVEVDQKQDQGRGECSPCRGTGKVISSLGG